MTNLHEKDITKNKHIKAIFTPSDRFKMKYINTNFIIYQSKFSVNRRVKPTSYK